MKVVAFVQPPQADVIKKILRHCGLRHSSRAPPADGDCAHEGDSQAAPNEPRELTFVAEHAMPSLPPPTASTSSSQRPSQASEGRLHPLDFPVPRIYPSLTSVARIMFPFLAFPILGIDTIRQGAERIFDQDDGTGASERRSP